MGVLRAPLGHWVIAVILGVAASWGMHAWLAYRAVQSAQTADLSWDGAVARHLDPSLVDAAQPAVATAQSILSDPVIASLAKSATLPSSANAVRIGEFRSRLQLRQLSGNVLQVQFRDSDPKRAEQTANAVAGILAAGTAPDAASAPAAVAPPVKTPPAAPVRKAVAEPAAGVNDGLAHSLSQLHAELSSTQGKVIGLNSYSWERGEHGGEPSSYRESKEQQLLTAQISAALKEVANLRADPANGGAAQEPLRRIQEALLSVWPAGRASGALRRPENFMGFNAAGIDASRLRLERAEFADAIAVVQKEQGVVQRLEPGRAAAPAAPAASAAEPPVTTPAPSEIPSAGSPAIAESEIAKPPTEEPFHLLRAAGVPAPAPLWPVVLVGFCWGFLYLAVAASRYRRSDDDDEFEEDYTDDDAADSQRMITPAKPVRPPDFFGDGSESRRVEAAPPVPPLQVDKEPEILSPETIPPADEPTPPVPKVIAGNGNEGEADPWVDNMMKTLSETSFGRMFETSATQERQEGSEAETGEGQRPIHPDRLAG